MSMEGRRKPSLSLNPVKRFHSFQYNIYNKQGATSWPPGVSGSWPRLLARAVTAAAAGRIAGGARVVAAVALVGHVLPFYAWGSVDCVNAD